VTLVSVVIPTKARPSAVVDAARSIFAGHYSHFELFVIDQSADDATREALAPFMRDSRFHYRKGRLSGVGAPSSRNIGIALSSGEIIACADDDIVARPDWLGRIVAEFDANADLEFLAGRLTAPPHDPATSFVPASCPRPAQRGWSLATTLAGANFSFRRRLFHRIGGYDECFGPGGRLGSGDDADLVLRILYHGATVKLCPEIEVVHTNGVRSLDAGRELLDGYARGNGAAFGRAARRGWVGPTLWYLQHELRQVGHASAELALGRRPSSFGSIRQRLIGFVEGALLPPGEGLVDGLDLTKLRR
jgi:glycosyltransferase involved in cell wall biosynthesis